MMIRTVLGDVQAHSLGVILTHEHLIIDNPLIRDVFPHIHLASVSDAVRELEPCVAGGIGGMVDAMPAAGGRRPEMLAEISRQTGIGIVATTGLHTEKYYEHHPWALETDDSVMCDLFVADIEEGIDRFDYTGPVVDRSSIRAGLIKVATGEDGLTPRARALFSAAAQASEKTGAPILTHTEAGVGALSQIEEFDRLGFALKRVVISHTDRIRDLDYHRDILESGVNVEYDQALRQPGGAGNWTAELTSTMLDEGFLDQIMLGTDGARRSLWTSLGGGPGLAWMRSGFMDSLAMRGVDENSMDVLFKRNPQAFLSLR